MLQPRIGRFFSALPVETPESESSIATANKDENDLSKYLRPSEIVKKLDDYVVGQQDAKRAVAIALRNRWRRRMLPEDMKKEIMPKNVLLVGPTGCGACLWLFCFFNVGARDVCSNFFRRSGF